eukprot:CAMPEP_0118932954 /NCGR_PEP_ID=MMETSP1169-20130426/10801_1 /TAXON_ID=36882 /ORGANISM="Pyramimonas obovata, Strain CCMP722" /LENGTH=583 /DNA_ID=CAMNT_0006875663 /DNA_START=463 /DNA_END=2215 /DNA_ORIENTATION=+
MDKSSTETVVVTELKEEAGACPYTAAKNMVSSLSPKTRSAVDLAAADEVAYPGPGKNPFQNLLDVMYIGVFGMEKATLHFARSYGPISRFPNPIQLGDAAGWTFLNDAELIDHVCRENTANYTERFLPDVYTYVTDGKGILGSGGAYNKKHRKMCTPFFQANTILRSVSGVVGERATRLCDIWEKEGVLTTDVAVQMQRLTLDIVGLVAFSHNFGQLDAMARLGPSAGENEIPTDRILHNINVAQDKMGKVFITPTPILKMMSKLRMPIMVEMEDAFGDMEKVVMPLIHARREALQAGAPRNGDLLEVLLDAQVEDPEGTGEVGMTDKELWEDVHDVMGAGHETTASTLTACLYSCSQHPEVDARVQAEIAAVLGVGEAARPPTFEDIPHLVYCQQVVKEVLRLYPPIPIFPRVAADYDVLPTGHKVVPNEVVFMSAYAMGRSEHVWDGPMRFDPDRFSPENEAALHRFDWVPFGAGPRMCMGTNFALLSTTLAFTTIMQRNKFEATESRGPVFPIAYDITMHFPGDVEMKIRGGRERSDATRCSNRSEGGWKLAAGPQFDMVRSQLGDGEIVNRHDGVYSIF